MSGEGEDSRTDEGGSTIDSASPADGKRDCLGVFLEALSTNRRRYVLYYLRRNELADVNELARYVTAAITADPEDEITDDRIEKTKTSLIHSDIPRLRETGVIEHDFRNGTVRYREPSQFVPILLRVCEELEPTPISSD